MGIFSRAPKDNRIHATKAGRFLADVQREQKAKKDEVAQQRAKKQGKK
jgi:hypothetical protein